MSAAEQSGQPPLVAAGAYRLGFVFISAWQFDQAEETARTAAAALRHLAEKGSPEAMSLWGALTLQELENIARLVGHAGGSGVTETVYRKQIRPVLLERAEATDRIFAGRTAGP